MLFFNANFICYYFYPTKKREEPKIFGWFLALLLILGAGTVSMAADEQVMNRKLGYFDNTRTVLFLPALFGDGDYAASYVNREMNTIFRYPYYRKLDTEGYTGKAYSPSELPALAEQTGADIVVMPVISRWQQIIMHPMLFSDGDAFIETAARIDIYSYKKADGIVRDDKASYWKTEDESFVRNVYILDEMMRDIYKTFPYRRVPTDIPSNLSGDTAPDRTPQASMNH